MIKYIQKIRNWYRRPNKYWITQFIEALVIIVPIAFFIRTFFYGLYQVPTGSMETTMLVGEGFFADKFTVLFSPPKYGDIISFNDPNYDYSDNTFMELFQRYVWGPSNWTKRVIGVPGDHIQGIIEEGKPVIYRNGKKLEEPHLNKYPLIRIYSQLGCLNQKSYDEAYSYEKQPFYRMNSFDVALGKKMAQLAGEPWILVPGTPAYRLDKTVDKYDWVLGADEYWVLGDNRLGSFDSRFWGPLKAKLIHGKIVLRLWSIDSNESSIILDLLKHPIDFWTRIRWRRFLQLVR